MPDLTRLSSMTRSQTVDELLTRRWVERGPIAASHARRVPVGLGVNLAADTPGGFVAEGSPTPKFKRPPVIETLLGVQFAPQRSFSVPHFGLFWSQIRSAYPNQEMKPPLGPEVEDFGMSVAPGGVKVMLSTEPEARCWFIDLHRHNLSSFSAIASSGTGERSRAKRRIRSTPSQSLDSQRTGLASSAFSKTRGSSSPR